jgi:hypothetical protein
VAVALGEKDDTCRRTAISLVDSAIFAVVVRRDDGSECMESAFLSSNNICAMV